MKLHVLSMRVMKDVNRKCIRKNSDAQTSYIQSSLILLLNYCRLKCRVANVIRSHFFCFQLKTITLTIVSLR